MKPPLMQLPLRKKLSFDFSNFSPKGVVYIYERTKCVVPFSNYEPKKEGTTVNEEKRDFYPFARPMAKVHAYNLTMLPSGTISV